ncbi:MAG: hypothetical protein AAF221_08370 [Pseudomonadota bacterium]
MSQQSGGFDFGEFIGRTTDRVADLFTLDFLSDRGLVGGQQLTERVIPTTTTDRAFQGEQTSSGGFLQDNGVMLAIGAGALILVVMLARR